MLIWLQIYFFDLPWPRRSKATILHWILLMIADCKERQREYCLQSGIRGHQNGWTWIGQGVREHKQKYSTRLSLMGQSPVLVATVNEDSYSTVHKTWHGFPGIRNSNPAATLKTGTALGLRTPKGVPCFSSPTWYKITLGSMADTGEAAALQCLFSVLSKNRILQAEMYKNWLVQRGQGEEPRNLFKVRQSITATQLWFCLSLTSISLSYFRHHREVACLVDRKTSVLRNHGSFKCQPGTSRDSQENNLYNWQKLPRLQSYPVILFWLFSYSILQWLEQLFSPNPMNPQISIFQPLQAAQTLHLQGAAKQ